jgi:GT2 family glycosyltransferase
VHDPTVSVLVLNLNGRSYLDACLSSLDAQTYPRDRFEVVVVDNGSTDGSLSFIKDKYPSTRVMALPGNQGFCAPYNAAIRSCDSEFVALLNNDARVDREWLGALVSAAERHHAVAVASKILDWSGETIDFVGGATSFIGHAWQADFRAPATRTYEERPLLFPCAGSALYSRAAFLDAGAFDEDFFAYFEDVDVGWRLNLFGGTVVLAPNAVTYHRIHGTSSRWALTQRLRLLERNGLAIIYKNYETATLERVLPAAIALLLLRAFTRTGIDSLKLDLADRPPRVVETHPYLAAHLIGLEDFCRQLPALRDKRQAIQQRRCRSDAALFELFGDPLRLHETDGLYYRVANVLIREFGIDELFAPARQRSSRPGGPPAQQASAHPKASPPPTRLPLVSVVILTALGATHLRECLDSLRQQTYPAELIEVVIVDNGSAEDPSEEVRARFPGARVLRNPTNIGFAAGNNQGAAESSGDYVAFLNDDTRVHPDWLRELVATARRREAGAVASYILDWSGTRVDFVDGAINFQGKGFQLEYDTAANNPPPEEKPLLFACGCALLIDRAVFNTAGGWDEGAFAYYEDVELGWRLHVQGHGVWLAPGAVVYHKHHGTSGRWPEPPRLRLYERNSLRNLFCLLEQASLGRALSAALLLAADRALLETGLSRAADTRPESLYRRLKSAGRAALRARGISRSIPIAQGLARIWQRGVFSFGTDVVRLAASESRTRRLSYLIERGGVPSTFDAQPQPIPIAAAAMLSGIYGFLSEIPQLVERRRELQGRRRINDADLLERFGTHWLASSGSRLQAEHQAMHEVVVHEFEIGAIRQPRTADEHHRPVSAGH